MSSVSVPHTALTGMSDGVRVRVRYVCTRSGGPTSRIGTVRYRECKGEEWPVVETDKDEKHRERTDLAFQPGTTRVFCYPHLQRMGVVTGVEVLRD